MRRKGMQTQEKTAIEAEDEVDEINGNQQIIHTIDIHFKAYRNSVCPRLTKGR